MKILHTGDLHIGKYVHDISMLKDQEYILTRILQIAVRERVDVILIAGDVYDRSVPTAEAVKLLDSFLTEVLEHDIEIIMISGNHDSPERLGFAGRILEKQGLHIAGTYEGEAVKVTLKDTYGEVAFLCIPYCKPAVLGAASCEEAVRKILEQETIDAEKRNVLLTHYFVTDGGRAPLLSDSETMVNVGGLDNIEASLFSEFDYVALGHIHRPQQIGDRPVFYSGSPLKYSFSEAKYDKSVNIVTLNAKGDVDVRREKLTPLHEMRQLKGTLQQIMEAAQADISENGSNAVNDSYVQVRLTDETALYDPIGTLRTVYPNIMQLLLEDGEREEVEHEEYCAAERARSPLQLYLDFYQEVRGKEIDEARRQVIEALMREAGS